MLHRQKEASMGNTVTIHKKHTPFTWFTHQACESLFQRRRAGDLSLLISKRDFSLKADGSVRQNYNTSGARHVYVELDGHAFPAFTLPLGEDAHSYMLAKYRDFDGAAETLYDRIRMAVAPGGVFHHRLNSHFEELAAKAAEADAEFGEEGAANEDSEDYGHSPSYC
jgi:hypothetical protein